VARVAIIGSGISGLSVACGLGPWADVTLFEAENYFGGHAHTVDITLEGRTHGVDTGFLVYNERTYPNLIRLFGELGVQTAASDMSFSVQVPDIGLEWSGRDMNAVFAQRRNIVRPGFLRMLGDIVRFNRITTDIAEREAEKELDQPICEFFTANRFGCEFRDWYFLPMIGCIWSCPTDQMLRFPVAAMIRFCHNHGLLQIANRPRWFTVTGGAKHYVAKMLTKIPDARVKTPVRHVHRHLRSHCQSEVVVTTDLGSERFDHVVFACHSDQSLALLANPSSAEREILGSITYRPNRAVLHTDTSVLPKRRRAWAAWNYERAIERMREQTSVCVHYLINRLQPLPFETPVLVSLNPVRDPRPATVHGEFEYSHPVFDQAAIAAQRRVPSLQGVGNTWYCGAWTRYGFHEDGLTSGLAVVEALKQKIAASLVASEAA